METYEVDKAVEQFVKADAEKSDNWDGDYAPWDKGWEAFVDELKWGTGKAELPGLGVAEYVTHDGGGEGEGDYMDVVFVLSGTFFRKDGFYSSYGESEWDGFLSKVKPVDRMVTFYERTA